METTEEFNKEAILEEEKSNNIYDIFKMGSELYDYNYKRYFGFRTTW